MNDIAIQLHFFHVTVRLFLPLKSYMCL